LNVQFHLNSSELKHLPGIQVFRLQADTDKNLYTVFTEDHQEYVVIDCADTQACSLSFKAKTIDFQEKLFDQLSFEQSGIVLKNMTGSIDVLHHEDHDFKASIDKNDERMTISLTSDLVKGSVHDQQGRTDLQLDLIDLSWLVKKVKEIKKAESTHAFNLSSYFTKDWNVRCQDVFWKSAPVGAIRFEHLYLEDQDKVHRMSLHHRDCAVQGQIILENRVLSADGMIRIDSLENLFQVVMQESVVHDGRCLLNIHHVNVDLDRKKVSGSFDLRLKDVFVKDVSVSELNILNFFSGHVFSKQQARSLLQEGMPIDELVATIEFEDKTFFIRSMRVKSGATVFEVQGTYDTGARNVDLDVQIYPKVSSVLPAVALLLGNIPASLMLAGVHHFVEQDVTHFNKKHLHLTGPLNNLQVQPWAAPVVDANS
jgi:uncharacterized protein YhdP